MPVVSRTHNPNPMKVTVHGFTLLIKSLVLGGIASLISVFIVSA